METNKRMKRQTIGQEKTSVKNACGKELIFSIYKNVDTSKKKRWPNINTADDLNRKLSQDLKKNKQ